MGCADNKDNLQDEKVWRVGEKFVTITLIACFSALQFDIR